MSYVVYCDKRSIEFVRKRTIFLNLVLKKERLYFRYVPTGCVYDSYTCGTRCDNFAFPQDKEMRPFINRSLPRYAAEPASLIKGVNIKARNKKDAIFYNKLSQNGRLCSIYVEKKMR
jgi:hypothetical protein